MDIVTQQARKRQAVVKPASRKGKSFAARIYGVSLSSVKRWDKRYDDKDWRLLVENSRRHDRRYPYDWDTFGSAEELNEKPAEYLQRSNNKPMRTLGNKSPLQALKEKLTA